MSEHLGMLTGDRIYRIQWTPGSDTLCGICHCGARHTAEEPVELWDWLLAHPDGHGGPQRGEPVPPRPVHAGAPA